MQMLEDAEAVQFWRQSQDMVRDERVRMQFARQIGEATVQAAARGDFILPREPGEIASWLENRQAVVIPGKLRGDGRTWLYYCAAERLARGDWFEKYPVVELGTLIRNPNRYVLPSEKAYWAKDVVRTMLAGCMVEMGESALVLSTSRHASSKRALCEAGMRVVPDRSCYPMLDALTCSPGCADGSDGRRAGVSDIIPGKSGCGDCIACGVNHAYSPAPLPKGDECYLLVSDVDRAAEVEDQLQKEFKMSATQARAVLLGEISS